MVDGTAVAEGVPAGAPAESVDIGNTAAAGGDHPLAARLELLAGTDGATAAPGHIATATVRRVDVLVSWNFKHIVNLDRIHGYNSVNLRLGYTLLEIRSPQEALRYEE